MLDPFSNNDNTIPYFPPTNQNSLSNNNNFHNQHKVVIENIDIFFPYSPNEIQIIYMQKIILNLNQKLLLKEKYKGIDLLESPASTGKTLCLLCSTLSWLNAMKQKKLYNGKIIFAMSSYSKISHIINELKKIYFNPKICILFPPNISCLQNENTNSESDNNIIYMNCRKNYFNCSFYKNYKKNCNIESNTNNNNYMDIEELKTYINENNICPFYYEKNLLDNADIIFLTHELLIDKDIQEILDYKLTQNILIIDDAHNFIDISKEMKNISINTNDIRNIINNINKLINQANDGNNNFIINITEMKQEIRILYNIINNLNNNKHVVLDGEVFPDKGKLLSTHEFISLFLKENGNENSISNNIISNISSKNENNTNNITYENIKLHINLLQSIKQKIFEKLGNSTKISKLCEILEIIYKFSCNNKNLDSFYFYLINENNMRQLNIINLKSNIVFKEIIKQNPFNIILSSDTLSPFDFIENDLKIKFDIKLQNDHLIQKKNYKIFLIQSTLLNNEEIFFKFDMVTNIKIIISLGMTINFLANIVANISGSIIIYFPSFEYLNKCYQIWEKNNLFNDLSPTQKIIFNPSNSNQNVITNKKFKNLIIFTFYDINKENCTKKYLYKNNNIKTAVFIGIPHENIFSDNIQLQMKYFDENGKNELNGEKWLDKRGIDKINRLFGKIINLMGGRGALICIDDKFGIDMNKNFLSLWLRNNSEIINIKDSSFFDSLNGFLKKIKNDNSTDTNCDIFNNKLIFEEKEELNKFCFEKKNETTNKINNNKNLNHNNLNINDTIFNLLGKKTKNENIEDNITMSKKLKVSKQTSNYNYWENLNSFINDYNNQNQNEIIQEKSQDNEFKPNPEILEILNNNQYTENLNNPCECPICFKSSKDYPDLMYSITKCHHVLCNICWSGWLSEKLECPLCKAKTRPKTLKRIIFT